MSPGAEKRTIGAEKRKSGAEKRKSDAEKRKSGAEKRNCTLGPPYISFSKLPTQMSNVVDVFEMAFLSRAPGLSWFFS